MLNTWGKINLKWVPNLGIYGIMEEPAKVGSRQVLRVREGYDIEA